MKIRRVRAHLNRLDKMEQQLGQPSFYLIFIRETNERIYTIVFLVKKKAILYRVMLSYTFLIIDNLKKIKNLKLFIIFHFLYSVTIFKYTCTQRIRKFLH